MLTFLNELANQSSNVNARCRIMLFRTLSILCFDDMLDDFRNNIRTSIKIIMSKDIGDEIAMHESMLYDLIGILEGVD